MTKTEMQRFDCGKHVMVQMQNECPWCEIERLRAALIAIAAFNPGEFRPLGDEIAIQKLAKDALGGTVEPSTPFPRGTCVTLLLPGFPTMPREGWTIETIDEPHPLKYRIRHPNGALLDVLPECIAVNRNGDG